MIHFKVYSNQNIGQLIERFKVNEVLIAMPSISRNMRLKIINDLQLAPVIVRLLPGIAEFAEGKIKVSDLREVHIKDILGRYSVKPDKDLLSKNITNKAVLVTGAGGSIGSELSRQIFFLQPKYLILYDIELYYNN